MAEPTSSADLLLHQGMVLLQQALDAADQQRANERLQSARAVASNLNRVDGGEEHHLTLVLHGTRVRNMLSNRDLLSNPDHRAGPDAALLTECSYCKALLYQVPEEEAQSTGWRSQRCVEHQDESRYLNVTEGPGT